MDPGAAPGPAAGSGRAPGVSGGRATPRSPVKGYPESVVRLIDEFARLPGIGRRSAERLAFHVLKTPTQDALGLARAALWELVMPAQGATLPVVVQLIQTADQASSRDQLWHRLKDISDNLQAYAQASQALGETPKWEYVWP